MHVQEKYRIRDRKMPGSMEQEGLEGTFVIPHYRIQGYFFFCISSAKNDWEHVSVTVNCKGRKVERSPSWEELKFIKEQFWNDDETVVMYHPAMKGHVSANPRCLDLWAPVKEPLPIPDDFIL